MRVGSRTKVREIGEKPTVIANDRTFRNGVSAQSALGASNLSIWETASVPQGQASRSPIIAPLTDERTPHGGKGNHKGCPYGYVQRSSR